MPNGYVHHVFISYPRGEAPTFWVTEFFEPELRRWLGVHIPDVRIFFDARELKPGQNWEEKIISSHLGSCCLVPIWLPPYFQSKWCMAEWKNMQKREQEINQREGRVVLLVYPIVFAGGKSLPEHASKTQFVDLSMFRSNAKAFRDSRDFLEFEKKMIAIADDLYERIIKPAPNWSADWTFEKPGDDDPTPPPTIQDTKPSF